MPYRVIDGTEIQHKKNGKWSKKQTASSPANAKKAMRLLHAVDNGWKPARKQGLAGA